MRTLEIVLILVNVLALLLAVKKRPQAAWFGIVGVDVLVLLLHGVREGFRYQMVFAYGLVVVLTASAVLDVIRDRPVARIPRVLRFTAIGLSLVLLVLTSVLAHALPVFSLPAPSGTHAVGVRYFELVDDDRTDPFLDGSTQQRELMVKLYYPAKPDDAKPFLRYFHGSTELMRAFAAFYRLPSFSLNHLGLVETHAKEGLEPVDDEPRFPVILFSHGAGTSMEVETSQSEDLASHGYVVVVIDHPYISAATAFPDRIVTAVQATTNFDTPEPAEPITGIMADDARFVIDQLGEMNGGGIDADFAGRLDLDAIGVIGHSVGGAVAYDLAISDPRVKAAVNLDGAVYVAPNNPTAVAPFLMIANDQYHARAIQHRESLTKVLSATPGGEQESFGIYGSKEAYDEATRRARENIGRLADVLAASGYLYTVQGCGHMEYSDVGLLIGGKWLRELIGIGGQTEPARCLQTTALVATAFFDHHLKGRAEVSLDSLVSTHPELKRVDLN